MDGPIVVGTDGSVTARRAVAASIELAVKFGQPLHVVYGYPVDPAREPGVRPEWRVSLTAPSWACAVLAEAESRANEAGVRVTTHGASAAGATRSSRSPTPSARR
jgi:nucleotide-binding universal stress UspA family protein